MRVAIAETDGYVSPRLAWTTQLRVAVIERGRVVSQEVQEVGDFGPAALIGFLRALGLDTVVCGGIPPECEQVFEKHGVRVIWGVIGAVSQVLAALALGRLRNDDVVFPARKAAAVPVCPAAAEPIRRWAAVAGWLLEVTSPSPLPFARPTSVASDLSGAVPAAR